MTENQTQRIAQSINETVHLLGKEKAYLPVNQNKARIAEYEAHLAKLWQMVAA